ncbi:conserved hypothetical protein [Leishmania mexicana MHOM/GT/2001/U1103]|uniref:Uncharacterized protein n=1 Tax=Leishmania mexicana (strain MHOM/GT/2001/U1103) TaxID=929439 RepID=E9AQT7_LEIMU|nr:conserved hypothetical protein [Leishmania mexicana MHOM/GT/2001/U1103]CBZ25308.1 conserved hypothetical protein [Leishmania mexicana MHOM/GT/2001/U1103]
MMLPNNSFFGKKTCAASAPVAATTVDVAVVPLRTPVLTAQRPPQPPAQRAIPAPAAAAATAQSAKARLSRRRDSAEARASVLATARHRRLLPLTGAKGLEHEVEKDGAAASAVRSTRGSALGKSVSLSSELQVSVDSSAPAVGSLLGNRGSSRSSSRAPAALSSPLPVNATFAEASVLEHEAATEALVRAASLHSSGSRLSDNASPPSEGEATVGSLTSLQQRLWGWTGGTTTCVPSATGHGVDMSEPHRGQGQQRCFKTTSRVCTARRSASAAASPDSTNVRAAARWRRVLDSERTRGERGKRVAHILLQRLLSTVATTGPFGGVFGHFDDLSPDMCDDEVGSVVSGGHLRPLCERAVAATYLLSSLVDGLPRHQQSLSPYIYMLVDFTFVSDTPTNRAILGGSVQDEELLNTLELHRKDGRDGDDRETVAAASGLPPAVMGHESASRLCGEVHRGSRFPCHIDDGLGNAKDLCELLYPSFTRMTYVAAHFDAARTTVELAHEVRSLELHQRNVPRLIECTHRHWMRCLMHAVLRAWKRLCHERKVQEQRQRARWAERWTCVWVRIALRRWRGYGALTLQIAEADSLAKALLAKKHADIERLENESASMQASCAVLQDTLHRQDEERDAVEGVTVQREQVYKKLLQHVREIDRVGSLMLRSLLLPDAPPVLDEATALIGFSAASTTSGDGDRSSSALSLNVSQANLGCSAATSPLSTASDELVVRHPPHTLVALPTLLQWAKACVDTVQTEYVSYFPDEEDEVDDDADVAEVATEGSANDAITSQGTEEAKDAVQEKVGLRDKSIASQSPHLRPSLDAPSTRKVPLPRATCTDGASMKEATRSPLTGLEMLLNPAAAEVSASTTRSIAASDTVLVPLHMILLLMRGCCGAQDGSKVASHDRYDALATTTTTSVTITSAADASLADDSGAATATVPSWDLVRTIELADRVILGECHTLLHKEEQLADMDGDGGSAEVASATHEERWPPAPSNSEEARDGLVGVSVSSVSIVYSLSSTTRENLQQVCRVVVDTYEQLTGTACIVTAEQLFERSRGTLLVLIAALMRYYTNWSTRDRQQLPPLSIKGKRTGLPTSTAAAHEGKKHRLNSEWSHPPHSHRGWLEQVQRQAQWIALSFSALHDAVRFAKRSTNVLSIIEQERVARLLQRISLTEFMDILCRSPDHTMQSYVDIIGVVERYAPSLDLVFHQYAVPLAQLCADSEAAKSTPTQSRDARDDGDAYITGNTVWNLLCLTCLAGKAPRFSGASSKGGASLASLALATPSPPLPATLHRPAVFSLIEHAAQGSVASTAMQRSRASMRSFSGATASLPRERSFVSSPVKEMSSRTKFPRAVSVSRKGRPIPCYARALRDDRHVDLRSDTGAVCVNYVQFVKLVIRLAHAWQCQQQQQPLMAQEKALHRAETGEEGGQRATRSLMDMPSGSPLTGAAASPLSSLASSTVDNTGSSDHVRYEAIDYTSPLCPSYFNTFLGGLLLPRLLGANRWIGAVQCAFRSKPVLELLAQHHDSLLTVFNTYQQPCESRGVRAALPPPFSTILASQVFTKNVDTEQHSTVSLIIDGGHRLSHVEHSSFVHATNGNNQPSSTATGAWPTGRKESGELPIRPDPNQRRYPGSRSHPGSVSGARDVGIVSVLRWKNVQGMAKDLQWHREVRLTETGIRHCFDHVVADSAREGEVLFFAEFLQLLCAIAAYAAPDPAVPLEAKLHSFFQTRVLTLLE